MSIKKNLLLYLFLCLSIKNRKLITQYVQILLSLFENHSYDFTKNGELWLLKTICGFLSKDSQIVLVDVGANQGQWVTMARSTLMSMNPISISFEPSPETFSILEKINQHNMYFFNLALSSKSGTFFLARRTPTSGRNTLHPDQSGLTYSDRINVELLRGDDFFDSFKPNVKINFLKIDVEGHELEVIKGFENRLRSGVIELIQFERATAAATPSLKQFFDFLTPFNYSIGKLYPDYIEFFTNWNCNLEERIGSNWIAINRESFFYEKLMEYSIITVHPK